MKRLLLLLASLACAQAPAKNFGNGTTTVDGDILVTFTSSGTFAIDQAVTARILVVGGGGGAAEPGKTRGLQAAIPGANGLGSGGTNGANKDGGAGGSDVVAIRWFAPKGPVILIKQPHACAEQ